MIDHCWTPGTSPFDKGDKCRVILARYPCPYGKDEHKPGPPELLNLFGYRVVKPS